ncbi:MarR family transcriptional regulator, transcriptional regulator for hemolysin [Methylobacterium phyllostachyos]|uniref:MarR family transcriptional regulator, transcriptional regulator for hemolysin n=1 Tax=Methylobacterium phyllostachyos TaxID=582672 RepID=A0A1H0IH33_9HYPH|nr:MarR family transcriptional regulator [Methylobacterium phyllostachyos]SDO30656.1 MarR family transcriptional regulator, transcriptional regulator for hemolysin [Methylobacterium phyllostachyos]
MPSTDDAGELELLRQTYTQALQTAGRQWRRAANTIAEAHGLSDAVALPLVTIGRLSGEPRQNALAEAVGIEGPSLVRLLDQLAAAGLVVRREDPSDRRAKVLALTAQGRDVVAQIEVALRALRAQVFAGISRADLDASLRVFAALQRHDRGTGETAPALEPTP